MFWQSYLPGSQTLEIGTVTFSMKLLIFKLQLDLPDNKNEQWNLLKNTVYSSV